MTTVRARLQLLGAAALFSTGGAAIKATTLDAWQVAGFRSGIAALALLLILPQARRMRDRRVWLVAIAYAATMVLFVASNKLTTAANTIFLQSTAPLYLLLLGPLLLKEAIRRTDLLFIVAVGGGMALFFLGSEPPRETAPDPATGNLLAALAGITWAFTILGLRWAGRTEGRDVALPTVVAGNILAFAVCLPFAFPIIEIGAADWLVVGYLGVFQIGAAYWLLTRGISKVPALEASVLLLLEPALNPIWAFATLGEVPSAWGIAGGAVILGAMAVKTWWDGRPLRSTLPATPANSSQTGKYAAEAPQDERGDDGLYDETDQA